MHFFKLFFLISILSFAFGGVSDHKYSEKELVPLYMNKVGPMNNVIEAYEVYKFPFCRPNGKIEHKHSSNGLSEDLAGDHYVTSPYKLHFRTNGEWITLCDMSFDESQINTMKRIIKQNYILHMLFDGIPFMAPVGEYIQNPETKEEFFLFYTHHHFEILYNGNNVIYINVTTNPQEIGHSVLLKSDLADSQFEFTYSARWTPTDIPFSQRSNLFQRISPLETEIHWISILNSCVLVLLLTGFLAIILLRIIRSDYARYLSSDESPDSENDYGWRLIHAWVFRFPPHINIFCALVGLGAQCLCILFGLLLLSLVGLFFSSSGGSIFLAAIILYALTSGIGGYVAATFYTQMGGKKWSWNAVLTSSLFIGPFGAIFIFVNSVAKWYDATVEIPFTSIMIVLFVWLCVGLPLHVTGAVIGKNTAGTFQSPIRKPIMRADKPIPPQPWYYMLPIQMMISGFLPFSSIYIELFYIFNTLWTLEGSYQFFGILSVVGVILVIVATFVAISLTYFRLAAEDWKWWWPSFLTGGSVGLFIFGYACQFYIYQSEMSGFLQASFFFLYMGFVSYFFFLALGTAGFLGSLQFVRTIYRFVRAD